MEQVVDVSNIAGGLAQRMMIGLVIISSHYVERITGDLLHHSQTTEQAGTM